MTNSYYIKWYGTPVCGMVQNLAHTIPDARTWAKVKTKLERQRALLPSVSAQRIIWKKCYHNYYCLLLLLFYKYHFSIIIVTMIIAKHEHSKTYYFKIPWLFPDFSLIFQISLTNYKIPWQWKNMFFLDFFPDCGHPEQGRVFLGWTSTKLG